MIRRAWRLPDGSAGWLLISQVEHARVSAQLAERCIIQVAAPASVREELLAAILHHDDGWLDWERAPQLDPQSGRPLSFTEISQATALTIWSRSIDAAARIGPLAAWMVAGHFLRLTRHGGTPSEARELAAWQVDAESRRREWLAAWQQLDLQRHTRVVADAALQWLWTFDEVSLWLCCTCTAHEPIPCAPEPYHAGRGTPLAMELLSTGPETAVGRPWRFVEPAIDVVISGRIVPAKRYRTPAEMLAAARPGSLRWRLARE